MTTYVSRPQRVEAIQWTGDNPGECHAFASGKVRHPIGPEGVPVRSRLQVLAGKDGAQDWVPVPIGHWLVHLPGDLSDIWPVEDEYFVGKYEPVDG